MTNDCLQCKLTKNEENCFTQLPIKLVCLKHKEKIIFKCDFFIQLIIKPIKIESIQELNKIYIYI